jgi:hypothetical protein
MITYADYLHEAERRKDEMAQAAQYRLRQQVPRQTLPLKQKYQRLLSRLGELLVVWGYQLQTRHVAESSASPSVG